MRVLAVRAAARAEQEIRAHPRLHSAFYAVITRNATVRDVAGRLKNRVRGAGHVPLVQPAAVDDPEVTARRHASVAARLGLAHEPQP